MSTVAEVRKIIDEWNPDAESFEAFACRRLAHVEFGVMKAAIALMEAEIERGERRRR